jgi:hypothetical protein
MHMLVQRSLLGRLCLVGCRRGTFYRTIAHCAAGRVMQSDEVSANKHPRLRYAYADMSELSAMHDGAAHALSELVAGSIVMLMHNSGYTLFSSYYSSYSCRAEGQPARQSSTLTSLTCRNFLIERMAKTRYALLTDLYLLLVSVMHMADLSHALSLAPLHAV